MSRPLLNRSRPKAKPESKVSAQEFHRRVFAKWGNRCFFGEEYAQDAAHIVDRNELGKHRYACPEENGRPVCRPHHDAIHAHTLAFPKAVYNRAVRALNRHLKGKLRTL